MEVYKKVEMPLYLLAKRQYNKKHQKLSGGGHVKRTWLADLRGKKRMSQVALADKVGVTPGHIADLETGRRDPGGKTSLSNRDSTWVPYGTFLFTYILAKRQLKRD
ncbi:helix-turn-helix transcriptional regulator [Bacillus cereus]|uniref:Transcriptional regulator n=1 Tax=Bacillus cereus (strain ATCC 14579 / DSM 31 / CCUG 7414 / JCM 2152 / NBRC 15305 / NCIMB 9373 / NCTC 2599 / NRRL B-3711) TaxID=226900 RepID=Q81EW2_BACCR|nr:helix-turn-helix transcriptional regulator [Bacillus cereus]NP_852485.1 Transcriptional regulator [Bacillus phage phBC6A51]AAP08825.1 Transcriptional regulator [Bacillus cereus ATCC 14579]